MQLLAPAESAAAGAPTATPVPAAAARRSRVMRPAQEWGFASVRPAQGRLQNFHGVPTHICSGSFCHGGWRWRPLNGHLRRGWVGTGGRARDGGRAHAARARPQPAWRPELDGRRRVREQRVGRRRCRGFCGCPRCACWSAPQPGWCLYACTRSARAAAAVAGGEEGRGAGGDACDAWHAPARLVAPACPNVKSNFAPRNIQSVAEY